MIIEYTLRENDYVQFYMYKASRDKLMKRRFRFTAIYSAFFLVLAIISYFNDKEKYSYLFLFLFLLVILIVPSRLKDLYLSNTIKSVKENYKALFNRKVSLIIDNKFVECIAESSTAKFDTDSCDIIIETKHGLYLIFKVNVVIIPKRLDNVEDIKRELIKIAAESNIKFLDKNDWHW